MVITGTHIAYLHICHRKLWLSVSGITMEHTSDIVAEGKLIGQTAYSDRSARFTEIEVEGVKIDFYDPRTKVIHEVKKSSSVEFAHIAQLKYYICQLRRKGIIEVTGILEYPKLKQRQKVSFEPEDEIAIAEWEDQVRTVAELKTCPPLIHSRVCKSCSFYDFCYSDEEPL